jgi:hypothetical protein
MKRGLIGLSLLFCCAGAFAQVAARTKIGVDYSMGNNALGRANILPSVTLSHKKHAIFAGPTFVYGIAYNIYTPCYGIQAGYQFFPNGQSNRFNLFFEYDMNLFKKQFKWEYYPWNNNSIIKRSLILTSFDNYLSFGFKWNITKAISFHTNVGLGLVYYKTQDSQESKNGSIWNEEYDHLHIWRVSLFPTYTYECATCDNTIYNDIAYYPNPTRLVGIFKAGVTFNIYSFKKHKNEQ